MIKVYIRNSAIIFASLSFVPAHANILGDMTLTLGGLIDLEETWAPGKPYIVQGRLSGMTTFPTFTPIYDKNTDQTWSKGTLIGLTEYTYNCSRSAGSLAAIPDTNKKLGLPLTFYDSKNNLDNNRQAWVIPSLTYSIQLTGTNVGSGQPNTLKNNYNGQFFTGGDGLIDYGQPEHRQLCLSPYAASVAKGGTKNIAIQSSPSYEFYSNKELTPGRYKYLGTSLYIYSSTGTASTTDNLLIKLNIITDFKVVRICKITNVANDVFNLTMNRENELLLESSLQYTCTGNNKPVYISAIAKHGTVDPSDHKRLFFDNTSGNPVTNAPWLMGAAYNDNETPGLTCSDHSSAKLIDFQNGETALNVNAVSGVAKNLNIRWAVCTKDNVPPGDYKASVEVAIYTKE